MRYLHLISKSSTLIVVFYRVGTGSVIAGLDEGLLSMRSGGQRRLYIPGELSFQKRLVAAPGRCVFISFTFDTDYSKTL